MGLTYDTGALIAAERNDRRLWALHRRSLERGAPPTIPAAVLVEAWRGHPELARLVKGCEVEDLRRASAQASGLLLGAGPDGIEAADATVVEGALRRGDTVVTSNRSHLVSLAAAVERRLGVIDI